MEPSKLKIGKRVSYTARSNSGKGKVIDIQHLTNGAWIVIEDKERGVEVKVRASQITS